MTNSIRRLLLAAAALLTAVVSEADNDKYLIEAEAFQFKGKWFAEKNSEAMGSALLRLSGSGSLEDEYDAVTTVRILEDGDYAVWVRSMDFAQFPATRVFRLSVNEVPMELAGTHGKPGLHWEKVGEIHLEKGETLLRLHDEKKKNARCDAILLVQDKEMNPETVDRKLLGKLRRNPSFIKTEAAAEDNVSQPVELSYDAPVAASVENGNMRLSFVLNGGRYLSCRAELNAGGIWRRYNSNLEDFKVYLITSDDSPLDNERFFPAWKKGEVARHFVFGGKNVQVRSEDDVLNPYKAGSLSEAIPVQANVVGDRSIVVQYITKNGSRMAGTWTLPEKGCHLEVELSCKAASDAMYSMALTAFQPVPGDAVANVLMAPLFQFRRISDQPVMMLSSMMQQPVAIVEASSSTGADVSAFVCADISLYGRDWGGVDYSPAGFSLHNAAGTVQPVAFAPVMGMPDSRLSKGQVISRKFEAGALSGGWNTALEYVSDNVFKVRDYRVQDAVSLTDSYFNIVELMKNAEYGGWDEAMKGFYDIEGDPGRAPTVVHSAPLAIVSAAIVADDEDFYITRALPTIEYTMSRSGYRWSSDIVESGYNKTAKSLELNPFDSQFNTSYYAGLDCLTGKLNPSLEQLALPYGQLRQTKGYSVPVLSWVQAMWAYKMTGDEKWLKNAVSTARRFVDIHIYKPSETPSGYMAFYNSNVYPHWWNLVDLYELTGESKFLDAATYGAASTLAGIRSYPLTDDEPITIHEGGRYDGNTTLWWKGKEKFRLGFPRVQGDVTQKQVPMSRVSPVGLGFEQPGTYFLRTKGKLVRPVFLNSWAPHLLRLNGCTGKDIYRTYARNAVIGRYANYPGYYATGYTDVVMSADFPYKGPDVSSIYYHHIPPHLAFIWDYLVTDILQRSAGNAEFPYSLQEGFVWFSNRVWGGGKGRIFNDRNVELFMRKGLVDCDNPALNYISARSDKNFWVLFANESSKEEKAMLRFAADIQPKGGKALVYNGSGKARKVECPREGMELVLPSNGFAAVCLPSESGLCAEYADRTVLPALKNGLASFETGTPFGKIFVFRIRSPFGWDSIYAFAQTSPQKSRKLNFAVRCNGESASAEKYPFECSFLKLDANAGATVEVILAENDNVIYTKEIKL